MTLYDTTNYMIKTPDTSPSLPDPTTVSGRHHLLINSNGASVTWTSSGSPTPFLFNGVAVASISISRGDIRLLYSDGVQWVVVVSQAGRRIFSNTAVTDASGNATFTFTPAFAAQPVVTAALQTTNANATEVRVTSLSASSCTVNVRQSPGVVILGISVLQVPQPLAGATVHLHAVAAGQV